MMTRLTWICHGATAANRNARFPLDEPLEEAALQETAALGPLLARTDRTFVSPTSRARQTAEALNLPFMASTALAECDYGRWAGETMTGIHESDPDGLATWLSAPEAVPHGGESIAAVQARVERWMEDQSGTGGHTIAITHATVIRTAVLTALRAPLASFWRIDVEPLSLVQMTSNGSRWSLRFGAA
ncbi:MULTISPECIES: histidine phosphatase family protein [Rhizobium]|nr:MULTISPECIES: histidine phosphatase family protein [Rhizobium]